MSLRPRAGVTTVQYTPDYDDRDYRIVRVVWFSWLFIRLRVPLWELARHHMPLHS
jgi:hypothetical protein